VPRDIAFSAALTLSAGTANGVPYLNGSKVVTTGSALTFDGSEIFKNSGGTIQYNDVRGSAAAGTRLSAGGTLGVDSFDLFQNAVGGYVFNRGNTPLIFGANNTERARITSTGEFQWKPDGTTQAMTLDASGKLGVGTTSPGALLDVNSGGVTAYASPAANFFRNHGAQAYSNLGGIQLYWNTSNGSGESEIVYGNLSTSYLRFIQNNAGSFTERARITSDGNLSLGGTADRATTIGTKALNIFDGTAPVGTLANGISLYSSSGEAYVMDAAGNATLFSPHDSETNEWIFKSKHTPSGKVLKIDVEKMLRFINDHFGLDAIHEFTEE
jgi:hypothetical protein